jgi:phage FluMu gp28-like protein
MVSLDRVAFDAQEQLIRHLLRVLPVQALLIDQNGIGMHLAENLAADTVAEGVDFTNASKQDWATAAKIKMERTQTPLPKDRDLAYQIHSVKKKITAAKHNVFDTEKNEKHHADKFWAWALALAAADDYQDRPTWGTAPGVRR